MNKASSGIFITLLSTIQMLISNYKDSRDNKIEYSDIQNKNVTALFFGSNNKLVVHPHAKLGATEIRFDCNNGICIIGNNSFSGSIRVGENCTVEIADGVSCTSRCIISTAEGAKVSIGEDCMIASHIEIRADDGHPIFDIETGNRINMPKSILIGEHVWLSVRSTILAGARIDNGSVIGFGSIVKGVIPNNCIAAGIPAKVIKKNIAWERPHLTLAKPFLKPDSSFVTKSKYWDLTIEEESVIIKKTSIVSRFVSLFKRVKTQ